MPSLRDGNVIPDDANGSAKGGPMTGSAAIRNLEIPGSSFARPDGVLDSRLHLSDRLGHQLVHLGAKLHFAKRNALGGGIA